MKKLKYVCKSCGYTEEAPKGNRGCPKCNILMVEKKKTKKAKDKETVKKKGLSNKRTGKYLKK